jgi:dipeptidyl aminopeptidase/acylaminoacyl peptidase
MNLTRARGILVLSAFPCLLSIPARGAEPVVQPNENLVAEGLPPIPKAVLDRVAPYLETRAASLTGWHPVKKEMLISTRFAETAQIHLVSTPMGARKQLTFYPERVTSASWRPKSGDGFVFAKDVGGSEFYQLFWRDAKTGATSMFTDGTSRNVGGVFSGSGKWLAYQSTKRTKKDTDVYVLDPVDPKSERLVLAVEGGGWGAVDWSKDEKTLLVGEYLSANESRYHLIDVATGKKTLLTPESKEKVSYGSARFSKDGKGVFVTTDKDSEFRRLFYLDLGTKTWKVLPTEGKGDVQGIDLSDDGTKLAYVVNEAGIERLMLLDLKTRKNLPLPKIPAGVLGRVEFHSNSKDLAFTLSHARSPSDVYSIDVTHGAKGKITRWTESETGGLEPSTFAEAEPISWKSFDGLAITGFLYRPPAKFSGPRPVIIDMHGGPESQAQPTFLGRTNYFLSDLGVAFIYPNVRGSAGFGKTFLAMDNGFRREDSVKDIGALLDWIGTRKDLDSTRVMVEGGSYGGYMTLACLTHYNDRLRGGIDVVGISNFVSFLEKTESYRRDLRRVEYGDERDPKMKEFLTAISPANNARKITKPIFIIQGKNDPRVPLNESEQMVAEIKKNGGPVWYLMAKDEGHGFAKKANRDFQGLAMIRFVEEFLLK